MEKELLIGHITDLHYPVYTSLRLKDILTKRITGAANLFFSKRRRFRPHLLEVNLQNLKRLGVGHLVITGDIGNLAFPEEFMRVRECLENVGFLPEQVTIVPGNHDVYLKSSEVEGHFWKHLGPYAGAEHSDDYPTVKDLGGFLMIGLSSAVPSGYGFAYGEIGETQLAKLEKILKENEETPKIIVLHHPPYIGADSFSDGLIDGVKLRELVWKYGADLLLHGHEHYDMTNEIPGPASKAVPVFGTGCAILDTNTPGSSARARLIRMENGVMTKTWVVSYRKKTGHWRIEEPEV
jgi:3',5'-cyclic AMP phosphodiesterase CpdA